MVASNQCISQPIVHLQQNSRMVRLGCRQPVIVDADLLAAKVHFRYPSCLSIEFHCWENVFSFSFKFPSFTMAGNVILLCCQIHGVSFFLIYNDYTKKNQVAQSIPCVTGSLTRKKPTLITGRSEREQQHQPQTWASEYQSLETWEMLLLLLVFLFHQASSNILIFAWPSRLKTKEVHRRLHRLPQASAQSPSPCLLCEWMKWCKG